MSLLDAIQTSTPAFLSLIAIVSLMVGSFLNVVIHRLPIMMERQWRRDCLEFMADDDNKTAAQPGHEKDNLSLARPRSRCPKCSHQITALENIPIISYLVLKGKCSGCGTAISVRYPLIELITALMSVTVAWYFGFSWQMAAALLFTWAMIALTFIDTDTQLLPDSITLPLLWLGILISLFTVFVDLKTSVIGAMTGYLTLWTVYQVFKLLTGKEGMGFGDFKLLAVLGAWMGWQSLPLIIILSSLVGAVVGITLVMLRKNERSTPIPFGPYLAAAGWISLIWGNEITAAYLKWSGGY